LTIPTPLSRSLPSGHASTAFAGCTFLSLYLAGKLHLFHPYRGHAAYEWVVVIPLLGAALIGISRSMDYRHSGVDIFIGMLLGIFFSLITYHLYYPHLTYAESHKPWPPRTSRPSLHPDREGDGEEVDIERTLLTPSRAEAQTL
jgi:diacylglycerol diphosphate phosphatase/phosphatidate phosphatase